MQTKKSTEKICKRGEAIAWRRNESDYSKRTHEIGSGGADLYDLLASKRYSQKKPYSLSSHSNIYLDSFCTSPFSHLPPPSHPITTQQSPRASSPPSPQNDRLYYNIPPAHRPPLHGCQHITSARTGPEGHVHDARQQDEQVRAVPSQAQKP